MNCVSKPRIAVIHPEGNINNNPSLLCFVDALADAGMEVHYFGGLCTSMPYQVPLRAKALAFIYDPATPFYVYGSYSLVLGVDEGLPIAEGFASLSGCPYAFISYEIMHDIDVHSLYDKALKAAIRKAAPHVAFSVVQDSLRGKALCTEYGVSDTALQYIPVAGKGCVTRHKSTILAERLSISREKHILLYMGSIAAWSKIGWAVQHATSLPEDWVLVVHSRFGDFGEFSKDMLADNVYLSATPFSPEEIDALVQSADACLALYEPVKGEWSSGKNIELLGLSSGKIATALQHGVPVVTNEIGLAADLIRQYEAGLVIDVASTSPFVGLSKLTADKGLPSRCHALFTNHLDFSRFEGAFVAQCTQLLTEPHLAFMSPLVLNNVRSFSCDVSFWALPCSGILRMLGKLHFVFVVKVFLGIKRRVLNVLTVKQKG